MLNLDALGDEGDEDGAEDNSAEGADSSNEGSADDKSDEGSASKAVSLADFLEANPDANKDFETRVQSAADKRFENKRRRDAVDTRRATQREDAATDARERAELANEGKLEELGARTAQDDKAKKSREDAFQEVAGYIEQTIRDNPQVADVLDADRLAEITAEVRKEGGDVTTFISKIGDAVAEARVETAMVDRADEIKTEVAAALKAAGVETRSENADEGADEDISRSSGGGGARTEFAEIQERYIAGTITAEAYAKAEQAHNERTQ